MTVDLARGGCDGDRVPEKPEDPGASAMTGSGDYRGTVAKTAAKAKNEKKAESLQSLPGNMFSYKRLPPRPEILA